MTAKNPEDPNMPQVGMIIDHPLQGKFKVLRNIYEGPFSEVYIVCGLEHKKSKYAMKCEKQEGNSRPVLKLDVLVLMSLKGTVGFPQFIAAGRTHYYRYCIMRLVGPDLGKLRRTLIDKRFSLPTALRILQQTLSRLEALHEAGWLSRDVKAPNFAIGAGNERSIIYMLDFGFSRKFINAKGEIVPPRAAAAFMGTFQYAALSSHFHKDQARKDDLESWLYMAVELLKGPLPWCKINGHKEHLAMAEWKRHVRVAGREEFFSGVPPEFDTIMNMIDSMTYYDTPDYDQMHKLIETAAENLDVTLREPFDWELNTRMIRKADCVGELGESNMASAKLDNVEDEVESDVTPLDAVET